jgi:hypothetical protein
MFLQEREDARARGDRGVERCMNVELARMGYRDVPVRGETTTVEPKENTSQPKPRPKRPKARCEHGSVPERCPVCTEEIAA